MRAMATGRTIAEVALAEAEAGRLKRALLLERGSGRLLAIWPETSPGAEGGKDNADLESGMIAAITEFATNVYADKGGELRMLDIGSGKVFLRASPRVIVAGEFGGELSRQRERRLDEAFLSIVEKHEEDAASCTPETIEKLLDGALTEPAKPKSKTPVMIVGAAAAGLAIWLAWGPAVRAYREWRIGDAFATAMAGHEALGQFPLRLDIEHASERVVLRGLAANEAEPQAVVEAIARASAPYRVERDVSIVALASQTQDLRAGETRAAATLQEAQAQIETLRAELEEARAALGRMTAAHESPTAKLRRFVESFAVFFSDSDNFVNPAAAAAGLDELAALLKASDSGLRVVGYADDIGATVSSRSASRKRADKIVSMLVERGVPRQRLALVSRSTLNPIADSALDTIRSRRVSFEVPYAGEFDVR
jgi:outer membrane protein OmpA-like peptidoglycan-associated protein